MRKAILITIFLAALKFSIGQSISGSISGSKRGYIVLYTSDKYLLTSNKDTIYLDSNGNFKFEKKYPLSTISGQLEMGPKRRIPIWIVANQKLVINQRDSSTLPNFLGALARINNYLQEDEKYFKEIFKTYEDRNSDFKQIASTRTDKYFRITDSMTTDRMSFLKNFFTGPLNNHERFFISQRKNELLYQNLFYKISYDNPPLEKLIFYQTHFKSSSPTVYKFSEQISFSAPELLNNAFFLRFSRMFFMELVFRFQREQKIKLSKEEFYDKLFSFINELSSNKLCSAVLKASFIKDEINFMTLGQGNTENTYSRFVDSLLSYPQIKNEAKIIEANFYKKLNSLYAFKKGMMAPSCSLTDSSGRVVSLNSFKGKLLYIDVWASWCGKCVEGIPYWNKLVDKYKGNHDVVFLTVSTDEEEEREKWLRLLNKFKPKGEHFISAGGTNSEFAKEFLVNSYPTNVLIDKEGRIIDIKADRPETIDLSVYLR